MGIITVAIAIASIIFGNVIFAILIIIAAFSLCLYINVHPNIIHIKIDERGVTRGQIRYPYQTLHSFWIDIEHPHPKIILRSKKAFLPLIIVPLDPALDEEKVHDILLQHLPEEPMRLPLAEMILEYLGF
ncbi:hypothetical protein BH11PAT3_BH11PAT3_0780 [soil metagenome]